MSLTTNNDISLSANFLKIYESANEAIDYVKIYENMVAFDNESAELVALAKAIEMWRTCTYGSQRNLMQEQAQMGATGTLNLTSSYVVGAEHLLSATQPLLGQNLKKSYNARGHKRKEQQFSTTGKGSSDAKPLNIFAEKDNVDSEPNLVMHLFKLFYLLHYYVHDQLPTPFESNDEDSKKTDSDSYEFLYGKFSISARPATLCLQEQCKRAVKSSKIFLFQQQINIDKLQSEDVALHTECQNLLNQLQVLLAQLYKYSKERLTYSNGVFQDAHNQNMGKELCFLLEQLIEKVRESNINVHLFKWEIARRKQLVGAWFSAEEEAQIIAAYEAENVKFEAVEQMVYGDIPTNQIQPAPVVVNEVPVATLEDCEFALNANGPVASTTLINFQRRHGS